MLAPEPVCGTEELEAAAAAAALILAVFARAEAGTGCEGNMRRNSSSVSARSALLLAEPLLPDANCTEGKFNEPTTPLLMPLSPLLPLLLPMESGTEGMRAPAPPVPLLESNSRADSCGESSSGEKCGELCSSKMLLSCVPSTLSSRRLSPSPPAPGGGEIVMRDRPATGDTNRESLVG